jgi:hypothetical protein
MLFLLTFHAQAQPLEMVAAMRAPGILVVTPLEETTLYSAPPGGYFSRKGTVFGTISVDQTYAILAVQRQQSGIGNQDVWFNIAPLDADGVPIEADAGWVRIGSTRQREFSRLSVIKNAITPDGRGFTATAILPQVFLEK